MLVDTWEQFYVMQAFRWFLSASLKFWSGLKYAVALIRSRRISMETRSFCCVVRTVALDLVSVSHTIRVVRPNRISIAKSIH